MYNLKTATCSVYRKNCKMTWFENVCCMLLPHAKRNGHTALAMSHFGDQWECQTLVNQSFVMMHLSGEVMDIDIMSLENSQSLFRFCRL